MHNNLTSLPYIINIILCYIRGGVMQLDDQKILEHAKALFQYNQRNNDYSFRDRYAHTCRVLNWARRIHDVEGGDYEIIKLAVIFHDVGWNENIPHSIVSKYLADQYLTKANYCQDKKVKVLQAIEHHSFREKALDEALNIESYIVMDADLLDEVGATSILWDTMATAHLKDASYIKAYERIVFFTEELRKRKKLLKTATGLKLYEERLKVIESFLNELKYELNI